MLRKTITLLALGLVLAGNPLPAAAQLACFSDVEAVRVQREQGLTNVTLAARASGLGTPLAGTVRLCALGRQFVWEFTELGANGQTTRRVVDAVTGALVPGA